MYCLFLDISCSESVFALFNDGVLVEEVIASRKEANQPCFIWKELLVRHTLKMDDIDYYACGVGPGSYTGIRNAAATVKGCSLVDKKPIIAVSSLLLFMPNQVGLFYVIRDGGVGGWYTQLIEKLPDATYICHDPQQTKDLDLPDKAILIRGEIPNTLCVSKYSFDQFRDKKWFSAETLPVVYLRKTQAEIERK